MTEASDPVWNVDMEVTLFHAMRGHKPAGVNKHFQMISIHDRLSASCKKLSSEDVWNHLSSLYDLQALNESDIVPFPNKKGDFSLPEDEISDLMQKNFPRTSYISSSANDSVKSEAQQKNVSKYGKQDTKVTVWQTPKSDQTKSEHKASSASKHDTKSGSSSSRSDHKNHSSSSKSSQGGSVTNTPEPSPKRAKRTRTVQSASSSPATPAEPSSKRRRQ